MILVGAAISAPNALAKVTLEKGGSGEVVWHDEAPCTCNGGAASVELATYYEGDWAAVLLDCANRFTINEIQELSFVYRHLEPPGTAAGPRMALLLEKPQAGGYIEHYLVISKSAGTYLQTDSCELYEPTEWWYGEWDGSDFASYADASPLSFSGPPFTTTGLPIDEAEVVAVAVFMGVVDEAGDGKTMSGDDVIEPGKAIVDCVTVKWEKGTTTYGGTYDLEQPWPEVENFEDDARWEDWTRSGLWGRVTENELYGEPGPVRPFPSPTHAAYFGTPDPTTGQGSYDSTGSVAYGELCSPPNILNPGDEYVTISFDYFREVEQYIGPYPWEVYDKTYVQIKFNGTAWGSEPAWNSDPWSVDDPGNGWKTIWYKDSSDPNSADWESVTIANYPDADGNPDPDRPIKVPPDATKVWIRFVFDSVDGYNNDCLGWLIDNVKKEHTPAPVCLEITTDTLPQGTVKEAYPKGDRNGNNTPDPGEWIDLDGDGKVESGEFVDANGNGVFDANEVYLELEANKPGCRWEVVEDPRGGFVALPPRLELERGTGRIYGHPEVGTQGTYKIKIRAVWGDGRGCNTAEKVFYLTIRSPEEGMVNVIATEDFSQPVGWTLDGDPKKPFGSTQYGCPNLWHETSSVLYNGKDIVTAEYEPSAYFGKNDNTDPNYNCTRAKGCLVSPWYPIPAEFVGEEIVIGFKSWREVEFYDGAFDQTSVWVQLEGREWKQVWYKDSRDPSEQAWTWEEVTTGITVPQDLPKVRVKFCFDSVDSYNNDFVGWLVDEVTIYAGSAILAINTECPMPEGSVGSVYKVELKSSGGPKGTREWQVVEGQLPPGLNVVRDAGFWIAGVPREAGTFDFTLKVVVRDSEDLDGDHDTNEIIAAASKDCSITITEKVVLLFEDFEADPQWSKEGLWHITDEVKGVPKLGPENHAAYYGQEQDETTAPNYNTGDRTTGALTLQSPVIDLTGVEAVKVTFDYWRWVEAFEAGEYDIAVAQVKFDTGTWTTIWKKSSKDPSEKEWTTAETPAFLVPEGATKMWIRFVFDSVDKWYNGFTGWLVDNIKVEKAPAEGAQPLSALSLAPMAIRPRDLAKQISVLNIPNPVRDVHTTTFLVRGVEAERTRVEVYDLTGRLVWQAEAEGNEVVWHTEDLTGLPLANGVYLYKVYIKVGGTWIVSDIQKVVILR